MNGETSVVKHVYLTIDGESNEFYINAAYEVTDEVGNVYLKTVEKLPLPLTNGYTMRREIFNPFRVNTFIDLGFGELRASNITECKSEFIKSAVKEMTIEEIEQKLGHKVKIVNKAED